MFTRAFDAISDMCFFISEFSGWGQLVFPAVNVACGCGGRNDVHFSRDFFTSYFFFSFGRPLFQLYYVNKILVQDSYVCLIFFFTQSPISSAAFSLTGLSPYSFLSAHTYNLCICVCLFNCYHLWLFCRALSFVFVDLMLPSILYLIKTERQRCRRHVSCAFFCSGMLA